MPAFVDMMSNGAKVRKPDIYAATDHWRDSGHRTGAGDDAALRRGDGRDHARFWSYPLGPPMFVAYLSMMGDALISTVK